MNQIQAFQFNPETTLRTVVKNNEVYFVVKDVCDALELVDVNKTISRLKEDYEQIQVNIEGVLSKHPLQTAGGIQEMTIVSETGLYDLIMQSRKPSALKFKHWITSEILPTLRKTGSYTINQSQNQSQFQSEHKFTSPADRYELAAKVTRSTIQACKGMGITGRFAHLMAAEAVERETGLSCFKEHLKSLPPDNATLTAKYVALADKYGFNPENEILRQYYEDISNRVGISVELLRQVLRGEEELTLHTAYRLALLTGVPPTFWVESKKSHKMINEFLTKINGL